MKKLATIFITLLAAGALFAQNAEKKPDTISAKVGKFTLAEPQGSYTPSAVNDKAKVRNVILLIGDGMGLGAVTSSMFANGGELTMTNLKTVGFVRTQSANSFTTDSAASGTAYATGQKTNNGFIGVNPDKEPIPNIPEKISSYGYACGVVTTDPITGATPASFFAHQGSRGDSENIAADLPNSKLCFASGGNEKSFNSLPFGIQEAIKKVYNVTFTAEDAAAAAEGDGNVAFFPASTGDDRGDFLPATTEMAIKFLSKKSKKGFFLMVEGAHIDHGAHSNKYDQTIREALDFDKAVEAAIKFAEKDGHTLVIISADHETGGIALRNGNIEENNVQCAFTTGGHTPVMVPLFAYGPKASYFSCVQENSDVSNKIVEILTKK